MNRARIWFCTLGMLAVLAVGSGCGPKRPGTVRVRGTVTHNGNPLSGARVAFFGEQGRPASGVTDDQGRFQLMTFTAGDGALPGTYEVVVSKTEPTEPDPRNPYAPGRSLIPERYGNRATSGLTATVQSRQTNDFRFELVD